MRLKIRVRNRRARARQDPATRERERERNRQRATPDPVKKRAWNAVSQEVRMRRLVKQPCEVCGDAVAYAHHDDYEKPLEIRWLCISHHMGHHYPLPASLPPRHRGPPECPLGHGPKMKNKGKGWRCRECHRLKMRERRRTSA